MLVHGALHKGGHAGASGESSSKRKLFYAGKPVLVLILIGNPWSRLFGGSLCVRLWLETKAKVISFQQTVEVNEGPL